MQPATLAAVAIIGLLVPLILAALVGFTPDTTLRVGDAGTFVSSNTSAGGFFALPATTLRTSIGSIVVSRSLSVANGKSLISMEHYAIAFVDELETPKHSRQRFTVGY
jgi:hypothetical protein